MEVFRKEILSDGTKIQIEDWSEDYPGTRKPNDMIVAFPKAKETFSDDYKNIEPKVGRTFRLEIIFENQDQAFIAFHRLLSGNKNLKDYKDKFHKKEFIKCL